MDQQEILKNDDGKMLRALGVDYPASGPKLHSRPFVFGALGTAVAILLVACLIIFYPFQKKIKYIEANLDSRESTLEELNSEIHDFTIKIDASFYPSPQITRTFDSISGDALYYTVVLNSYDSFTSMVLVIICNIDFQYSAFEFEAKPDIKELLSYPIKYHFNLQQDEQFALSALTATAEIDGKQDTIYVTKYLELLFESDPSFFNNIQQIVQLSTKN